MRPGSRDKSAAYFARMAYATADAFSLIELLIVITILGIITAIAVPSWQQQLLVTRRADAAGALLRTAMRQEQFLLRQRRYAANSELGTPPPDGLGIGDSFQDHYEISIASHASGYLAIARVRIDGGQARDTRCWIFNLDAAGRRSSLDHRGHESTAECWR